MKKQGGALMDSRYLADKDELKPRRRHSRRRSARVVDGRSGRRCRRRRRADVFCGARPGAGRTGAQRQAVVAAPQMGQGRHGRRLELDDARQGPRRRQVDQGRQDLSHRARLRVRRCRSSASAPSPCASRAAPPVGRSAPTAHLQRRIPVHRDRPDRHAVRWPRPHRHPDGQGRRQERDALLQRRHRAGDGRCLRHEEERHRARQAVLHPRPSVRPQGAQGRA